MNDEVREIVQCHCQLGENPLWHSEEQCLYWCDITAGKLLRYRPDTQRAEVVLDGKGRPDRMIGGFTIQADGALLLFMAGGRIERWHDGATSVVVGGHPQIADSRFNDVIADPEGRVFCGTMPSASGSGKLFRLEVDGTLTPVVEGVGCSNGLAFSADLKRLYYTDSAIHRIDVFDYDRATGSLSNRTTVIDSEAEAGVPDGLTMDADGNMWSARWEGACVTCYAPDGRELRRIALPVSRVTSLTFGGDDLRTLFITSAQSDDMQAAPPNEGNVFARRPGVTGRPEFRSRILI